MHALGIDVGSTTVKVVVLDPLGAAIHGRWERHGGRAVELCEALVAEARAAHAIGTAGVTGSIGVALAGRLSAVPVHEVRALALAVRRRHPGCRTVVELGGQDAKLLTLSEVPSADDAQMNDRCAAGTGATLDRVARRLALDEEALASLRLCGELEVAARCGVFAETDVVNLVKRGGTREEAMSALGRAVVAQCLSLLARGRVPLPPLLLAGGPHARLPWLAEAWRISLERIWRERGVAAGPAEVPPDAELLPAVGAALHAASGGRPLARVTGIHGGALRAGPSPIASPAPAELEGLVPAPAPPGLWSGPIVVHLGIDAGSTSSKAVLLDGSGSVVASAYAPGGGDPVADAGARLDALRQAATAAGAVLDIRSLGVTGYGAALVGPALGADATPVETLAHAEAALRYAPDADVVVDVGGTDVKVLRVDGGRVADAFLSTQCAAGMGAFLASAAVDAGSPVERFAERAFEARRAPRFTVGCAIFVDTDRVTFLREGFSIDEVLCGLALALPRAVWEHVVEESPARLGRSFVLTGGVHRNTAVALAHARYLRERVPGARVRVAPHPELSGAIGAALAGRASAGERSRFVGLERAARVRVRVETGPGTRCRRCELRCPRSFVELGDRLLVTGNACDRGADPGSTGRRPPTHATDLVAWEARALFRPGRPLGEPPLRDAPVIGVPRVMCMYRAAPLLLNYMAAAGVPRDNVVLSPPTSEELLRERVVPAAHDPCFPAKLALVHAQSLLRDRIEVLLMPALSHAAIAVGGTCDTASCPIVAASGHTTVAALRRAGLLEGRRAIVPDLCVVDPPRLRRQLHACFGELLGIDAARSDRALEHGLRAQRAHHAALRRRGERLLDETRRNRGVAAVLLARPYHADPGLQHGITTELAARGIPVLGIAALPAGGADLSRTLPRVTNSGSAERVWAAGVIAADPHLVAVDLSSFRCGQDASVAGPVSDLLSGARKPVLRLHELDEHRPGATLRVRIETFVASVHRYRRDRLRSPVEPILEAAP